MTHSTRHFLQDQRTNTPPATELNQFHPDPARKLSTNLVCKHRIILYRQNLSHLLEYFTVLTLIFHRILSTTYFIILTTFYIHIHTSNFYPFVKFQYDIYLLLCLQWITPDDGQRNCPKHVEFHFKIKFEKISASSWFYYNYIKRLRGIWRTTKTA
jgi:hypothetical protein